MSDCGKKSGCGGSTRKHTPITSEAQQGLFGSELARRKEGKESRMKRITTVELESHLHEAAGKNLPKYSKRSARGSGTFTEAEIAQGYRKIG